MGGGSRDDSPPASYPQTMSTRRVMGTETEYGVSTPSQAGVNHMLASSQVVNGYAGVIPEGPRDRRTRWDFEEENPLRDARGFEVGIGLSDHLPGEPEDIFRRALRDRAFEVSELSMGSHIVTTARGDSPCVKRGEWREWLMIACT